MVKQNPSAGRDGTVAGDRQQKSMAGRFTGRGCPSLSHPTAPVGLLPSSLLLSPPDTSLILPAHQDALLFLSFLSLLGSSPRQRGQGKRSSLSSLQCSSLQQAGEVSPGRQAGRGEASPPPSPSRARKLQRREGGSSPPWQVFPSRLAPPPLLVAGRSGAVVQAVGWWWGTSPGSPS